VQISLRASARERRRLKFEALRRGTSVQNLLRDTLKELLRRGGGKGHGPARQSDPVEQTHAVAIPGTAAQAGPSAKVDGDADGST
jgi:hypothetical protein